MATTVDEDQRAARSKAAKIEEVHTGRADEALRVRRGERRTQRGEGVQRVAERDGAIVEDFRRLDRGDGNRRVEVRPRDTRTGHDDQTAARRARTGIGGRIAFAIIVHIGAIRSDGTVVFGILGECRCGKG